MSNDKTKLFDSIKLNDFEDIMIWENNGVFSLTSTVDHGEPDTAYDGAWDALESFILACACNGVPFTKKFREALQDTYQAIVNHLD